MRPISPIHPVPPRPRASRRRTAATKTFSPSKKPVSCSTARCVSAIASSTNARAPETRWSRPARSGKQNILEGSQASGTSKESELKLTNVARASLEELLEDYRDFLRTRGHPLWDKNSKEAQYVRKLGLKSNASYESYRPFLETRPPQIVANILICLIHQANYLLDQQLRRLERDFLAEGGLRERMTRARLTARARRQP